MERNAEKIEFRLGKIGKLAPLIVAGSDDRMGGSWTIQCERICTGIFYGFGDRHYFCKG